MNMPSACVNESGFVGRAIRLQQSNTLQAEALAAQSLNSYTRKHYVPMLLSARLASTNRKIDLADIAPYMVRPLVVTISHNDQHFLWRPRDNHHIFILMGD